MILKMDKLLALLKIKEKLLKPCLCILLTGFLWGCDDYERTGVEESIYVNQSSLSMFVGGQVQLTASPADNATYTWTSEDPAVATVSNGLVEAVGEGVTNIVAGNGIAETKVPVTVDIRIPLTGIQLSENTLEMSPDEYTTVLITLVPDNANDIPATTSWTSENTSVAVVDAGGKITAIAEGVTSIVYRIGDMEQTVVVDVATSRPFKGPHILSAAAPCVIPAADFDLGGEGNAFHDNNSSNSTGNDNYRKNGGDSNSYPVEVEGDGNNIGYTGAGEWLLYTVEVEDAGDYLAEVSLSAAGSGGKFHLEVDGTDVTGSVDVPNNGSWSNWRWLETASPVTLTLTAGRHQITFYIENSGYNFRTLRFTKK